MLNGPAPCKARILVVEDSYLTAQSVCDLIVEDGYEVVGPVGYVDSGIRCVCENAIDAAIVDIDLHGKASFPICEQLAKRTIPFVFLTGYGRLYPVPAQFRTAPWLQKPLIDRELRIALAGLVKSILPAKSPTNLILDRLPPEDRNELETRGEHVSLATGDVLETAGQEVSHVYFPTEGLVSMTARATDRMVEIALVGREGALGLEVALGKAHSAVTSMVVHSTGAGWRLPASDLAALIEDRPALRAEMLGAVHAYLAEIVDCAVMATSGTVVQRLARRLMMLSLRLGTRHLALTHDAVARLMAVRRAGITVALHILEGKKLIRARRNAIEILDYEGLSRISRGSG